MSVIAFGGLASLAAGAVHASAAGIHAEHRQLAQIFIVTAALQMGVGLWALIRPTRAAAWGVVAVNAAAVVGWAATRMIGISWIDGLETAEAPQFADTACALLGLVAIVAANAGALLPADRLRRTGLVVPAVLIGAFSVWTMMAAGTHVHSHDEADHGTEAAGAAHSHGDEVAVDAAGVADASGVTDEAIPHAHDDTDAHTDAMAGGATAGSHDHSATAAPAAMAWPRPWDPTQPIDVSGVEGVSAEQELRAVTLIEDTLRELPKYADPADAIAAGYTSIGDAGTGSEHYIKADLIGDDVLLDPTAPESLVYAVNGDQRTLAGAMYIASARPADDPTLTDWAGPLMTWHKHDNLCWSTGADGKAKVVGVIDANGNCANGVRSGGESPMVHVWIEPHPCGVFAALEGIGAGTAAVSEDQRVDMCSAGHDHGDTSTTGGATAAVPKPYDPTMPIDLSGTPGVTPQQQAAAENLIAVTLVRLPQWSDYKVAEAFGFRSIGDGGTGHEHFIQWDWINDDVILDPDQPESLVFEPQPDGSKKLVSAMYMLSTDVALEDAPDIGGPLMQWHIHDNLCYTNDPEQPRVAGLTNPDGSCPNGLVKHKPAPMIHVWITPHKCGPFASLEGAGAGQIVAGQERLCDHQHGGGS
ncbi:MAG TPA: hypothetical protein VES40_16125, partial [Ilumatobacteraceae bacterium]|nr:hypothetical protein [Ilumatobacteraceae bacterium]